MDRTDQGQDAITELLKVEVWNLDKKMTSRSQQRRQLGVDSRNIREMFEDVCGERDVE
jgi:hypothetical protein